MSDINKYEEAIRQVESSRLNASPDLRAFLLTVLREAQERHNPQPLTLEQLKERVGKWVWIKSEKYEGYVYLQYEYPYEYGYFLCTGVDRNKAIKMSKTQHGTAWLAYDHKPKEE